MDYSKIQNLSDEDEGKNSFSESDDGLYGREQHLIASLRKTKKTQQLLLFALGLLYIPLAILTALNWASSNSVSQCEHPDLVPSPARESGAIEYETRRIKVSIYDNPFVGDPTPEIDKAWHDMFENNNIRVSGQDLAKVNLTSLELADGSGYVAQLGFYHELHCLKRIRHWIYRDYYHSQDSPSQTKENKAHVDHCIEMLRQSSICHADTSLSTFRWLGHGSDPRPTAEDLSQHQCVNWPKLRGWIEERAVHLSHEGVLRRPSEEKEEGVEMG